MNKMSPAQTLNQVGRYLYKHIDGATKIKFSANQCDVYLTIYYQKRYRAETFESMDIDINLTTYSNKLRVNVIEMDEWEKTLGSFTIKEEELDNLAFLNDKIYQNVCKYIVKEYSDYEFVF